MIAAAVSRPLRERQKNAVGGEITGRVIAGCSRQESWASRAGSGAAFMTKARHRLRHLFPTTAMTERTISAVAIDRSVNEPLAIGAHHAAANARLVDGFLEIERIPRGHGLCNRLR